MVLSVRIAEIMRLILSATLFVKSELIASHQLPRMACPGEDDITLARRAREAPGYFL